MKSAVSTENGLQSHSYCIWWRRAGAKDRFRHWVLADSMDEAIRRSRLDITKALGTNASLWKIEDPEKHITAPIATEVVRSGERPRGSSHRVRIITSVLLLLCLLLLFHLKSNEAASAGSMEADSVFERITK
jgi:hypothetical protein